MKIIKQKLQEIKDINTGIQCSTLEYYDIKAPLAASPHQALKIFGLKKSKGAQGSVTDHLSAVTE